MLYRVLIRPFLFLLTPETAHRLAFGGLRLLAALPGVRDLLRRWCRPTAPELEVTAWGKRFPSPVGLAAGFDKDAEGYEALGALGFGFVEVGTLTAQPQPGNPRPRLFRLSKDRALLNRLGFNNCGSQSAARRLARPRKTLVGVNVGKTRAVSPDQAVADYRASVSVVADKADYVVVNVSSPNTPGLRELQGESHLAPLLRAVREELRVRVPNRHVPLLVKIAPDLSDAEVDRIADLALEQKLDGIIATNTTIARSGLKTPESTVEAFGQGGISGLPLRSRAYEVLCRLRRRVGDQVLLVAAGGIASGVDAWSRIRAGASLVQIYTAFVYEGPGLPRGIAAELVRLAREAGYARVQDAVGADVRSEAGKGDVPI